MYRYLSKRLLRRRSIGVCREGLYYTIILGFVFGGAVLREINLLIAVAGIMIGVLLFSTRLVIVSLRRLQVSRQLPEGVSAGDLLVVDITVRNKRRRLGSWAVTVEDTIRRIDSRQRDRATASALFPYVAPGESVRVSYRGRLGYRGRYRFGPLKVSTRFPLGLVRRTIRVDDMATILVFPRLGRLTPQWSQFVKAERLGSQRSQHRQGLMEGEFHGLRDWRSGDSRRWIHWRTSAKRDQLSVIEFERQQNQDLTLLLDLWQPKSETSGQRDNVEWAISFVATIVADQCRRGSSRLLVGTAGAEVRSVAGVASMITLREIMEMLALAEADSVDRLPELLDGTLSEVRPGNRVIVLSTRPIQRSDTQRFASVWEHPHKRAVMSRAVCLDVSNDECERYFQAE